MNRDDNIAILLYASRCPFSQECKPNFKAIASLFPTIRHFAFEESAIRQSIISRYGIHGFPTLFLLNSTMRVRGGFRCAVHFNGDIFVSVRSSDVANDLEVTKESFGMVDMVFKRIHCLLSFEDADLDPCTSSLISHNLQLGR